MKMKGEPVHSFHKLYDIFLAIDASSFTLYTGYKPVWLVTGSHGRVKN